MDLKALHKISYGLYVIASKQGDAVNGQVANAVMQICSEPVIVAVSINKENLTHSYIQSSKLLTISFLSEDAPLSMIRLFGFQSGRRVDKFAGISYNRTETGVPFFTENCVAYLEASVRGELDAWTHTIFAAEVVEAAVFNDNVPMTYSYYLQAKRGGVPRSAPTFMPKR